MESAVLHGGCGAGWSYPFAAGASCLPCERFDVALAAESAVLHGGCGAGWPYPFAAGASCLPCAQFHVLLGTESAVLHGVEHVIMVAGTWIHAARLNPTHTDIEALAL